MCRLGSATAGTYPVMVSFPTLGYSRFAGGKVLNFTYQLIITSSEPSSGSIAGTVKIYAIEILLDNKPTLCLVLYIGGTLLTVRGFGFSKDTAVTIGSNECKVVHATETELNCRTPAVSALTVNELLSIIIVTS